MSTAKKQGGEESAASETASDSTETEEAVSSGDSAGTCQPHQSGGRFCVVVAAQI